MESKNRFFETWVVLWVAFAAAQSMITVTLTHRNPVLIIPTDVEPARWISVPGSRQREGVRIITLPKGSAGSASQRIIVWKRA